MIQKNPARMTDMENIETIPKAQYDEDIRRIRKMYKPNNAFNVPVHSSLEFFKWWCVFIKPFINLTDKERDVIASFLNQRYELSKTISDTALLDTVLMTEDIKKKVIEECHITLSHFYVVMSTLRKKQVIKDNKITPKLIPDVGLDNNGVFKLTIVFKEQSS